MRTPEVEKAISNTKAGMYCTDDADTLAAEVERLEAEHIEAMAAITAASRAAGQERTRAETAEALLKQTEDIAAQRMQSCATMLARVEAAEARVKELEREAADSAEEWAFCGLGVGSAAAAAMKHMEILKKYREQSARLRAALESLQSDAQCTIDMYNKIGPTWTSRDSGAEYYDASYVIGSAEERIATIKAALADTKGTT